MKRVLSDMYFLGRKCIFCGKYGIYRLADKRVKCKHCNHYYSLKRLRAYPQRAALQTIIPQAKHSRA